MKKILFTLAIALNGYYSYAQFSTSTGDATTLYNVGIGTTAPDASRKLTISGATNSSAILFNETTDASSFYLGVFNAYGNGGFAIDETGVANRFTIQKSTGNVGIGTTSPSTLLHLSGSSPFETIQGTAASEYGLILSDGSSGGAARFTYNSYTGENKIGGTQSYVFQTFYTGGSERLRINANGNVGIGTTSPDEKLTVKGNIHAAEVKVEALSAIPDYVFEPEYNLKDLSEVKTYVDKNHHLPEIPSAAQIEKEGINLGDMNMKLLKKVEELTLYLIEQQKQITEQNNKLAEQQSQINQLVKRSN